MSFGNIIKKLRSDRNMTQEQLAEVLSISAQAVSRWETNIALPDISLLPILANFFDVTTDFLLEVDASSREKEIESLSEAAREYTTNGQWSKGVEILRKAIRKYPSAYKLSHELASALYCSPQETDTISDEHYEKLLQEVVSLEEVIDILNIIFEDKNYGFFKQKIAWTYLDIAWFYAKINNRNETIKYLTLAKNQSIDNDKAVYKPTETYTCLIARGKEYGEVWHNINANDSMHQINEMDDKIYDFIRDDVEFKKIAEELRQYAHER